MPLLVLTVPMAFAQSDKCDFDDDIIHDIQNTMISDVREQIPNVFQLPGWLLEDIYNDIRNGDCELNDNINNIVNLLVSSGISINMPDKIQDMNDNIGKYQIGKLLSSYGFPLYDVSFEYEYNYYKPFIDVLGYDDISPKIKDRTYVILSTQFIPQVNQKCACAEYLSMYQLEKLDNELTSLMKQYNINKLSDVYMSFQ